MHDEQLELQHPLQHCAEKCMTGAKSDNDITNDAGGSRALFEAVCHHYEADTANV